MDAWGTDSGFIPQKSPRYNKLLPYADKIDEESYTVFSEIKGNLGRAVALRDIKVGASHWVGQLTRYIRLYGFQFSKEDHVVLIKLLYEMVTIPELEMALVQKFTGQLVSLLKKRTLLSRDDLVLPWRPLYQLVESVLYSTYELHGLQLFPHNIETTLKNLVRSCRTYFSVDSTREMMEEWRPLLCPFDITVIKGLFYFELFLPTTLPPEQHDRGFKLWLPEFIDMWDSFHNTPSWENSFVSLFSRLTEDNIGYVDWSPYVSKIFNRYLRSFNLPVGTQHMQIGRTNNTYDNGSAITWIVFMLGGGSSTMDHIEKFFKALHTFYHPSNLGKWNIKLSGMLMNFPKIFVRRLHRERYKKASWRTPIPDSHKLSEQDITRFVEHMKPLVFLSMFSKYGSTDSAVALRHLSTMRPELIVPILLEKMYPAMETLTEPHRLIACMNCVVSVARPMLTAGKWYMEGPSHVLPLLNLALPGIDPNDFKKCLVTFQMISAFVSLVPIVDCSDAVHIRGDLSEHERELCSATAQFEDFVLLFVDRVLSLVENSAQEHVHGEHIRLNPEQSMLEVGLASTFCSVLQQCSAPIYESALRRLHNFVTGSIFETRVGGKFAANLCRAAAKVKPEVAVRMFLPHFANNLKQLMANNEDIVSEEQLDNGFLWNLLMMSQLVRCDGRVLLPYKDLIKEVIVATLHLKCIQGYEIAGQLLRYTFRALTLVYSLNYRSISESFDRPVEEYLAIRDWAKPGDLDNLGVEWHIPSEEEMQFASELMAAVLGPELNILKNISSSNVSREELLQRLNAVLECILGAGSAMPTWKSEEFNIMEPQVPLKRFVCTYSSRGHEVTLHGQNVREAVIEAIRPLLAYMMSSCEDDTKSLFRLLRIYESLLFFRGTQKSDFDGRWKSFHMVKQALEDKLRGGKKHIRALLVDRVQLQHELRLLNGSNKTFTVVHRDLLQDLLSLSLSRYSEVRKKAQGVLFMSFHNFPYSYRCIMPEIVESIKNSDTPEHKFKGALFLVMGNGKRNLGTKKSWEIQGTLWPALVQAQHSEKPSILKVIDDIINKIVKNVESTAIKVEIPAACIASAQSLLKTTCPPPIHAPATDLELQTGQEYEVTRNAKANSLYHKLIDDLVELVERGNLMWKFSQIGLELLSLLLRHDVPAPVKAVELFVKYMVHDALYVRKVSLGSVSAILKQQKRKHSKVTLSLSKVSDCTVSTSTDSCFLAGDRKDNAFMLYNSNQHPDTKEKWENNTSVEKTHWGYYCWPREMKVYSPMSDQPNVVRCRDELSEGDRPIYDAFQNKEFVEKLVSFLALEENKGKDKFRNRHMTVFKGLFRNFGDTFLEQLKPHIERLVKDTSHDKHDSSQRCAMEMMAGILRGAKHWPYEKVSALWDWAIPVLTAVLNNMTVETVEDWGTFFTVVSESRDCNRLYRYLELLMSNPLSGEGGSFGDASRLFAVQNALVQQEWRVPELLQRMLDYLKPHLSHPYKNVRDRMGSLLSNIFLYDYKVNPHCQSKSPQRRPFIEQIAPRLEDLKDIVVKQETETPTDNGPAPVKSQINNEEPMETEDSQEESDERKEAIRLCKTVLKWISNSLGRWFTSAPPELFKFLPIMCTLESETKDDELKSECSLALACMSQAYIQPEVISVALSTIREVAGLQSWHARGAILSYLQVMVFCNFFSFNQPKYKQEIQEIVIHLICDDQLEVRQMAAITLSGLLHCGFLEMNKDMMDHFELLSKTKLKKRQRLTDTIPLEALIRRHAGVLGLGAYVQAYPYDVPDFMPQVLMNLSDHVNDPQPIQHTVKNTLSNFRRTHHDNWHDHKLMFTDDQLVILTDLLVSPNYYA